MSEQLLVLLEGQREAQRLCVTWPAAWKRWDGLVEPELAIDMGRLTEDHEFAQRWAAISGVDQEDVAFYAPVLFDNGLLLGYGQMEPVVAEFLRLHGEQLAKHGA